MPFKVHVSSKGKKAIFKGSILAFIIIFGSGLIVYGISLRATGMPDLVKLGLETEIFGGFILGIGIFVWLLYVFRKKIRFH